MAAPVDGPGTNVPLIPPEPLDGAPGVPPPAVPVNPGPGSAGQAAPLPPGFSQPPNQMQPPMGAQPPMGQHPGMGHPGQHPGMGMGPPMPMMPGQPGMHPGMQPGMHPGMQPGMHPGMQMPGGMNYGMAPGMMPPAPSFAPSINTTELLAALPYGIFVKQKFDVLEVLTGMDMENTYMVYERGPNPETDVAPRPLFMCKEKSTWCARNCMAASAKPFEMKVFKCFDGHNAIFNDPVLSMFRECKCTCLCFNRPELVVYYTEGKRNDYLGKVVDTWDCMHHSFQVIDAHGAVRYTIQANCCQCGLCCKCPCEPCEKVVFELWSGQMAKMEGQILKLGKRNILQNMLSNADNFSIPFPPGSTWQDRSLLLSAVLMIDFMLFEEKQESNTQRSHRVPGIYLD